MHQPWTDTALWRELESRASDAVRLTVQNALPDLEQVLADGGSADANFTLHDAGHGFRVAQLMADIAGPEQLRAISAVDLAVLLLCAYGHDIGMTPPRDRVLHVNDYLATGDERQLDADERAELQRWLDDAQGGASGPLEADDDAERLAKARLLTAHYVRARHNDWSADWLREHWAGVTPMYAGWLDDVIAICRSHHEGYDVLAGEGFAPRLTGNSGEILHRRWCACLLRVADVLDFDPERTPDVIRRHRGVEDSSAIFWAKDHQLHFLVTPSTVTIHAEPESAVLHKAVVDTITWVDAELALCLRLFDAHPPEHATGTDEPLPHRWTLGSAVHARVTPRGARYEYIDGAFRPDTSRVLSLLGGLALYGSPLAAVREILQNAFDAVRVHIATEQLRLSDASEETEASLRATHRVVLRLEERDDGTYLVCSDDGIGMSRQTLRDRFLVSGKPAGHRELELERRCRAAGIPLRRTARFGIGVLSYFLLGEQVTVTSRPRAVEGTHDEGGWTFAITGREDFGELRDAQGAPPGVSVSIRLSRSLVDDGSAVPLADRLGRYLRELLLHVPCRFRFEVGAEPVARLDLAAGWASPDARPVLSGVLASDHGPRHTWGVNQTKARRGAMRDEEQRVEREITSMLAKARFVEHSGTLHGLLRYRVVLVSFEHADGCAFFHTPERTGASDRSTHLGVGNPRRHSWNGMDISIAPGTDPEPPSARGALTWIDWISDAAGELAVSRQALALSSEGQAALEELQQLTRQMIQELVRSWPSSRYDVINARMAGLPFPPDGQLCWPLNEPNADFRPITAPVADGDELGPQLTWCDQQVPTISAVAIRRRTTDSYEPAWTDGTDLRPSRLLLHAHSWDSVGEMAVLWEDLTVGHGLPAVRFPPTWGHVATALVACRSGDSLTVLNRDHPLVQVAEVDAWLWSERWVLWTDPLELADASPPYAAAWLLSAVTTYNADRWKALGEQDAEALAAVFAIASAATGRTITSVNGITSLYEDEPGQAIEFRADGTTAYAALASLGPVPEEFLFTTSP